MKTLHKIFHKNLWMGSLVIFATSIVCMLSGNMNAGYLFITTVLTFVAFFMPFGIFLLNSSFISNVPLLINQHFNRKTLIGFFLLSNTFRFIFLICTQAVLFFIYLQDLFSPLKDQPAAVESSSSSLMVSELLLITFSLLMFFIFILYLLLSIANNESYKKEQGKVRLTVDFVLRYLIIIMSFHYFPKAVSVLVISFIVVELFIFFFNRTFKLYEMKKFQFPLYGLCLGAMIPYILIILLMRNEVHHPSISHKNKTKYVVFLGKLNKEFNEEQKTTFLASASVLPFGNYSSLVEIFELDFNKHLSLVKTQSHAKEFFLYYNKNRIITSIDKEKYSLSENQIRKIMNHMDALTANQKQEEWDMEFLAHSYYFFKEQRVGKDYIDELASSSSSYRQLLAFRLAKASLSSEEFLDFSKKHAASLNSDVSRFLESSSFL